MLKDFLFAPKISPQPEDGDQDQVDLAVAHRVGEGHRTTTLRLHVESQREIELIVCSTSNIVTSFGFSRVGGNIFRRYWSGLALPDLFYILFKTFFHLKRTK